MDDVKDTLIAYLDRLTTEVLAKLDGLGEYDLRRPLTPTGTNLLGVVKHLASVQAGYFGEVFGRPWPEPMPWLAADAPVNADMVATADESSEWVKDFYRRSWDHARATFDATAGDATGTVPWWPPERRHPTLSTVLIHMATETARHAGHLDIVRELIDGSVGRHPGDANLPTGEAFDWAAYVEDVQDVAEYAYGHDVPQPWYAVRCHFLLMARSRHRQAYEERVTLWKADSFGHAAELAEAEAEEYASGDDVRFLGRLDVYHLFEAGFGVSGKEVYSAMRKSDLAPDAYLSRYFYTGTENMKHNL